MGEENKAAQQDGTSRSEKPKEDESDLRAGEPYKLAKSAERIEIDLHDEEPPAPAVIVRGSGS